MSVTVSAIESKVLVLGSARLAFPSVTMSVKDAVRHFSKNFPQLRLTRLYEEDGVIEGSALVYTAHLPPPKVNG